MIPTLSSSALLLLLFLICLSNHLSQISRIKGKFVYVKKTCVKAIGDPLMGVGE